jgi:hypothetical protein
MDSTRAVVPANKINQMKRAVIFAYFLALLLVGPWIFGLIFGLCAFFIPLVCDGSDIFFNDDQTRILILIVTGFIFSILTVIIWGRLRLFVNKHERGQ